MNRNVTIDPLARAQAVESPAIKEVLSLKTGRIFESANFIRRYRYGDAVRIRDDVSEAMIAGSPRFVCALCHVPVYLVASPIKAFFFRHRHEDGSCPAITRSTLTEEEVRARKYAGVQESEAHKRIKSLLLRSIDADPQFDGAGQETIWRSAENPLTFRRPDVSCTFDGLRVAFEAQLSTTFLSVVAGRRAFYRSEGALLVWVLARFDPSDRRMTEDDILFPNNSNVIVVNEETAALSERERRFVVRCHYRVPSVRGEHGGATWESKIVPFDQLTLDVPGQRAFLIDVEGIERAEREEMQARERAKQAALEDDMRTRFLRLMNGMSAEWASYEAVVEEWQVASDGLGQLGFEVANRPWETVALGAAIKLLRSAAEGRPTGWKFTSLVQVAHHLFDNQPNYILLFGFAVQEAGFGDLLKAEDRSGAWAKKASQVRQSLHRHEERFRPALDRLDLLEFLLPESASAIAKCRAWRQKPVSAAA